MRKSTHLKPNAYKTDAARSGKEGKLIQDYMYGLMGLNIMEILRMAWFMEKVLWSWIMAIFMKVIFIRIK